MTKCMCYIWKELCAEVGVAEYESRDISRIESGLKLVEGHWVISPRRLGGTTHRNKIILLETWTELELSDCEDNTNESNALELPWNSFQGTDYL